jgi:hypothetical protein
MLLNVLATSPVTVATASAESVPSVADDALVASTWNATVTSDPAAPSTLLDVITAGLESIPSGATANPHGSRATSPESCPSITRRRTVASTGAYATTDSQGPAQLSWRIHLPAPLLSSAAGAELAAWRDNTRNEGSRRAVSATWLSWFVRLRD